MIDGTPVAVDGGGTDNFYTITKWQFDTTFDFEAALPTNNSMCNGETLLVAPSNSRRDRHLSVANKVAKTDALVALKTMFTSGNTDYRYSYSRNNDQCKCRSSTSPDNDITVCDNGRDDSCWSNNIGWGSPLRYSPWIASEGNSNLVGGDTSTCTSRCPCGWTEDTTSWRALLGLSPTCYPPGAAIPKSDVIDVEPEQVNESRSQCSSPGYVGSPGGCTCNAHYFGTVAYPSEGQISGCTPCASKMMWSPGIIITHVLCRYIFI
jgi:hypothetical protein